MRGGSDDFYASLVGLVVGLGTRKSWQKAVVDVDYRAANFIEEVRAEHLHVAGEDD